MKRVIPQTQMTMVHYIGLVIKNYLYIPGRVLHITFYPKAGAFSFRFVALVHGGGLKIRKIKGTFYWQVNEQWEKYFNVVARENDYDIEVDVFYHIKNEEIITETHTSRRVA